MPKKSLPLFALTALLWSMTSSPAEEKAAKPEEQAREVCKQFWNKLTTKDMEGVMKRVALPWYDNQDDPCKLGHITRDTEEVNEQLKKIFGEDTAFKVEKFEVWDNFTYDQATERFKSAGGKKMLEVMKKTDRVLSVRLTVVHAVPITTANGKKVNRSYHSVPWVLMLVSWRDGQAKIVGIRFVRDLTPEDARAALIEFIERSSDGMIGIKQTLPRLKTAKIAPSEVGGKWLDIGPWACDLKERKVSMMQGGPPITASYVSYKGDLELSPTGKWRVTNVQGGYTCILRPQMPPPPPPRKR